MTAHGFDAVRTSPFYRSEHEAFRQSLRKFVAREIEPFANDWTRPASSRANSIKRRPRLAIWASAFLSDMAEQKVTASCASSRCRRSVEQAVAA